MQTLPHPVRPASYMEISNFSLTIYEKGAEVVRMIHTFWDAVQKKAVISTSSDLMAWL